MPKQPENKTSVAREESLDNRMITVSETAEVEMTTMEFGTEVESTRSDGQLVHEVVIGSSESSDGGTVVLARKNEEGSLLRVVGKDELARSEKTEQQIGLYYDVATSVAESAVKAAGLKGKDAKDALIILASEVPKVIALSMGEKDPEKTLSDMVREEAKAIAKNESGLPTLSLEALTEKLAHARQKADGAKNDREFNSALVEIHAVEKAIYNARVELNPDATKKEKTEIADQVDGAVEIIPDPLYEEGFKATQNRIVELEKTMRDADKNKDGIAWMVARNEYDRHRAILPVLEKVDIALDVQAQIDAMVAEKIFEQNEYSSKKREKLSWQKNFWKGVIERQKKLLRTIEDGISELTQKQDKEGTDKDVEKLESKRLDSLKLLQTSQKTIQEVENEMEVLENMGVLIDFDTEEKPQEARNELYFQLMDMYKENPEDVMKYIDGMLKSKKVNQSTLGILNLVKQAIRVGSRRLQPAEAGEVGEVGSRRLQPAKAKEAEEVEAEKPDAKVISIEPRLRKTRKAVLKPGAEIESVFEQNNETESGLKPGDEIESVFETKPSVIPSEVEESSNEVKEVGSRRLQPAKTEEKNIQERDTDEFDYSMDYSTVKVPDLINAGIVENAGELELLERSYIELYIALDSLGLKPEDEGLPSSFDEMVNTEDSRGVFGRLFGRKTERVKLFNKLKQAHYMYIDSGKVDVGSALKRQNKRYEDYSNSIRRAGKF